MQGAALALRRSGHAPRVLVLARPGAMATLAPRASGGAPAAAAASASASVLAAVNAEAKVKHALGRRLGSGGRARGEAGRETQQGLFS